MGIYFERVSGDALPIGEFAEYLGPVTAERFCDSDGEYQRKYNVYKISSGQRSFVLKKSDRREADLYRTFLLKKGFAVPEYYGDTQREDGVWLLMEHIDGPDLRRFDGKAALACAKTLAEIQNAYWECGLDGSRYQKYMERIHWRAQCLAGEPELAAAYRVFLERQETCPRTLSSGDFIQFNAVMRGGRAYMLDWAFGGVMPYALDAARLIAHGTEQPDPLGYGFPFYMDDSLRKTFLRAHYEGLGQKPGWERYLADITLAVLNEYVEFLEEELNELLEDPRSRGGEPENQLYYRRARETAARLLNM